MTQQPIHSWIKTECGRAKYQELSAKPGAIAKLRLLWLVLIAAPRHAPFTNPDQHSS